MKRRVLPALALTLVVRAASAQQGSVAIAESLFREGKQLLDKKDYAHACPKLAESHRQDPATGTLLALALCYEGDGKLASAWSAYVDAAARAKHEGRADREQAANGRANALEPTLSKLTINVAGDVAHLSGLQVQRDEISVGSALFGNAVPADGGVHTIVATAPGKKRREWVVQLVAKGDAKSVTIDALDDEAVAETPPKVVEAPHPEHHEDVESTEPTPAPLAQTWRTFGLVVGGLGAAGLVTTGAFAIVARRQNQNSLEDCSNNICTSRGGYDNRQSALRWGNTATITFIASSALVGAGLVLYLVGTDSASKHVMLAPTLSGPVVGGTF